MRTLGRKTYEVSERMPDYEDDPHRFERTRYEAGGRWGKAGSGLFLVAGGKALLLLRSASVTEPGTWGIPGGAIPVLRSTGKLDDARLSAIRETTEETGIEVPEEAIRDEVVFRDKSFTYTTFIAVLPRKKTVELGWENDEAQWLSPAEISEMEPDLHPGLRSVLPELLEKAFPKPSRRTSTRRVSERAEIPRTALVVAQALDPIVEDDDYTDAPTRPRHAATPPNERRQPVPAFCISPETVFALDPNRDIPATCKAPVPDAPGWRDLERQAMALLATRGILLGRRIGMGSFAVAFLDNASNERVIKLTGDVKEAAAVVRILSAITAGETSWDRLPALAHYECVLALEGPCDGRLPLFAITMERLVGPIADPVAHGFLDTQSTWKKIMDVVRYDADDKRVLKEIRTKSGARAEENLRRLILTMKEMDRIGVRWFDLHTGNVLEDLEGTWKIVDLGASRSREVSVPLVRGGDQ